MFKKKKLTEIFPNFYIDVEKIYAVNFDYDCIKIIMEGHTINYNLKFKDDDYSPTELDRVLRERKRMYEDQINKCLKMEHNYG